MVEFNPESSNKNTPPAARKIVKAKTPFLWLRRAVLFFGLLSVAGVVLVFVAYNFGKEDFGGPGPDVPNPDPSGTHKTVSRNVDYVQTSGGRQVFRVRAAKSAQDKDDTSFLEDAIFDFFKEGGTGYTIQCQKARLNQRTGEAFLEGDVQVTGFGNLVLLARALNLSQNGQLLESKGVVEFRHSDPDLVGRASHLLIDRSREQVEMDEGVHIRSAGRAPTELRLDCLRLVYSKAESMIRATDKVYLRYGDQELRTGVLSFFLQEDQRTLRSMRARYDVVGQIEGFDPQGGILKAMFEAAFLEIEPDDLDATKRTLRLDGENGKPALLKQVLEDGLVRSVQGYHLEALILDSRVSEIRGDGLPVRVDEYLDFPKPIYIRRACATQLRAYTGPDGAFSHLLLDGQVDLQEIGIQLSGGDAAKVDGVEGTIEISGAPVEVNADQGELSSPLIRYSRKTGLLKALSGVRAGIKSSSGAFGGALGGSVANDETVRIDADEATMVANPRSFVFKGQARAWQGDNFLFADQIRGDASKQELAAGGSVKTIWLPPKRGEVEPVPIVVTADTLSYRRQEAELVYDGNAKLDQTGRFLTCKELTLELTRTTPSEVKRLLCKDNVVLDDTLGGQRVTGDFAVYDPKSATVEITGDTVQLVDRQKNELMGRFLTYDFQTGKASLKSQIPSGNSKP